MLLHDSRNDDGIKSFFQEVHELYIKVTPFPTVPENPSAVVYPVSGLLMSNKIWFS